MPQQRTPASPILPELAPVTPPRPPAPEVHRPCDCCPDLGRALADMLAQMAHKMPDRAFNVTLRIDVCQRRDDWDPPVNANGVRLDEFTSLWSPGTEGLIAGRDGYIFVAHGGGFAAPVGPAGYLYGISASTATAVNHVAPPLTLPSALPGSGGSTASSASYLYLTIFRVTAGQAVPQNWLTWLLSQQSICRVWAQF